MGMSMHLNKPIAHNHSHRTLPMWLCRLRTVLWGIPLLVVSCGTAPQPTLQGQTDQAITREASHPQAYYHFLQGSLAELNNDGPKALEEYQAGLAYDKESVFLKFRLAKLHFSMAQMTAAVDLAKQIPVEKISSAAMFLDLAKIFAGAGDTGQAMQVLKEGEQQFPQDERMYLSHGTLLLNIKEFQKGEAVFHDLLSHVPESAEAHYFLGIIDLETKTKQEAKEHFQQAIILNPSFERGYLKLVALSEEDQKLQEATELLEKYLKEINPHHREFRLRLVRLYISQDKTENALSHLNHLLQQNPDDLHAQVRKAQIFGEMGDFPAAIEELNAILRVRPNELRVRDFLGLLYEEMKDYEQATLAYQKNLQIDPTFFDSLLHLGFVSYRLKQNEKALSYLEQAVKLNPKRPESYLLMGLTYFQMEKYQEAKTKLEEGILHDPSNAELHFNLGTAYDKLDRFDKVVQEMEQTLELDPEHADALNYLGYSYADRGINGEKALSLTQRAVALKPQNGYYVDSLAWALYKLGRIEEALETIQRAISLVSDDPVIYEHLGEIFLVREEQAKAREAWIQSLQLDSTNEALKKRFRDAGFGEPIPTLSHQSILTP
jgi:tetratricopeptide (TPR) repeat protein